MERTPAIPAIRQGHGPPETRRPGADHWRLHARQWRHVGPPLKPHPQDVAMFERMLRGMGENRAALLLGVTPEIAAMGWPRGTRLLAVDRSMEMIHEIGPGSAAMAVQGDWRQLPVTDASLGAVVGDGCFTLLGYPDGYRRLLDGIARSLREGGLFVMRWFCRPAAGECLTRVADDFAGGRIAGFHALKWRVAMALHGSIREGVCIGDVWRAVESMIPDREATAARTGWPRAELDTIDAYRDSDTRYTFPTLEEVRAATAPAFDTIEMGYGEYELRERCPVIAYRRL